MLLGDTEMKLHDDALFKKLIDAANQVEDFRERSARNVKIVTIPQKKHPYQYSSERRLRSISVIIPQRRQRRF